MLCEDIDMSFRTQLRGYRCLYIPEAIVYYKANRSIIHGSQISVYYSHRNLDWVYIKNMPVRLIHKTLLFHVIYGMAAFFFLIRGRGGDLNGKGVRLMKKGLLHRSMHQFPI